MADAFPFTPEKREGSPYNMSGSLRKGTTLQFAQKTSLDRLFWTLERESRP